MAKQDQTWIIESDYHCGSKVGLRPNPRSVVQKELLKRRRDAIRWAGPPPDVLLINGDGTDGEDKRGRDTDQPNPDIQAQWVADMAYMWRAKTEYIITAGTRYHETDDGWPIGERIKKYLELLCHKGGQPKVKVTYRSKLNTTINGWFRLQARHKIGSSTIPHGRTTAPARSKIWGVINAALNSSRNGGVATWPHLVVFSHVHYFLVQEDAFGAVAVTPCWQALGGRYGDEQCDGHVDIGCYKLTVGAKEGDGWLLDKRVYQAGLEHRVESR
jgi:hypothetical protein